MKPRRSHPKGGLDVDLLPPPPLWVGEGVRQSCIGYWTLTGPAHPSGGLCSGLRRKVAPYNCRIRIVMISREKELQRFSDILAAHGRREPLLQNSNPLTVIRGKQYVKNIYKKKDKMCCNNNNTFLFRVSESVLFC